MTAAELAAARQRSALADVAVGAVRELEAVAVTDAQRAAVHQAIIATLNAAIAIAVEDIAEAGKALAR